ncbi:hypothetical protein [Actinoplanes sp. DH11]|uniref:hypothetical protein n=1 Tax=Actinoplanes sp. DH11 TaxID=2857011 RepID=UPI001E58DB1C|nr:hypothetical protein [Actinoplanes sp. DH11]
MVRILLEDFHKTISHDTDALVALYAEDLPTAYRYWQIGDALRTAGRRDEAITWLRRGLTEAAHPNQRIDDLLATLLTETGSHDEAAGIRWRLFTSSPSPRRHRELLDAAERAGTLAGTAERADAHLHERAARGGYQADPLVEVLLAAGDADAAWAAGVRYRCGHGILWRLAQDRAATHPADVIPVYAAQVEQEIEGKNKKAYAEAARLMSALRELHERAGSTGFADYVASVKQQHRLKPSLLAALTKAGL